MSTQLKTQRSKQQFHALVFGASSVSGWSMTETLLSYPDSSTFANVTGITNKPLTDNDTHPRNDPRLSFVSGVDLTESVDNVAAALKTVVVGIDTVTHVYYINFRGSKTGSIAEIKRINTTMLETAIKALEIAAPNFKFFSLQTGSNHYGTSVADKLGDKFGPVPLKESLERIAGELSSHLEYYYDQVNITRTLSKGKSWSWCDIRPDTVIGFTPNNNPQNLCQSLGLYLSFFHHLYGDNEPVPFPGSSTSFRARFSPVGADTLARFSIYASLHPESSNGHSFNIADSQTGQSWSDLWPQITRYFKLKPGGVAVLTKPGASLPFGTPWLYKNRKKVKEWEERCNVRRGGLERIPWWYLDYEMRRAVDRTLDVSESRRIGYDENVEVVESFKKGWDRMRRCGILPSAAALESVKEK